MAERPLLPLPGAPGWWLGANFWSRAGGPRMWQSYDPQVVRGELETLRDAGLTVTRSFVLWQDFVPAPHTLDDERLADWVSFLDQCAEVGIATIPTFIVGHMSGRNFDPDWRQGGDLYADGWLLAEQAFLIRALVGAAPEHPAVVGWLLSNEMPNYTGPAPGRDVTAWAELLVQAVRAAGGGQPVSTGDGGLGTEVSGLDNGFSLGALAAIVDWLGPHTYLMGDDPARHLLGPAFACELAHFGKPVVLEEFGVPSAFTSEDAAGDWYRQLLHTSLLAGATGWLGWNNTDFDLVDTAPYSYHPYELGFGLTRADGAPKAALHELTTFRGVLDAVDLPRCRRPDSPVALVVSSFLDTDYPFTRQPDRDALRAVLLQAYVSLRQADLPPAIAREADGLPDAALLIVPSTKQLLGPTWAALEQRARAGALVYVSWFAGDIPFQRGQWHVDLDGFFGICHRLRYGLVESIEGHEVALRLLGEFGGLAAGTELVVPAGGTFSGRSLLPLEPVEAEVLALDIAGRPALLRRPVGNGAIVLCAYPLEYLLASTPNGNPADLWRLYGALASEAGTAPPVAVDRPDVLVDRLVRDDGTEFVWLVSHAQEEVVVAPRSPRGLAALDGSALEAVTLPPMGVGVCRLQ